MTAQVVCDGPRCENTQPDERLRTIAQTPWMKLEQDDVTTLHFCSRECLHRWSGQSPPIQTDPVDGRVASETPDARALLDGDVRPATGTHHYADDRRIGFQPRWYR